MLEPEGSTERQFARRETLREATDRSGNLGLCIYNREGILKRIVEAARKGAIVGCSSTNLIGWSALCITGHCMFASDCERLS